MKKVSIILLPALFAGLFYLLPLTAAAQDEPAPLAEIWLVTAKTGHMVDFQAAFKQHLAVREKYGDPWKWQGYTSVVAKDLARIAIRYCCIEWADIDSYEKWNRDNPDVNIHWYETVEQYVEKTEHYFEQIDWENSNWNEEANSYRFFGVTEWTIKSGSGVDFVSARNEMSQIALNQGWANEERNWIWTTTIGGRPTQAIVIPFKNYSDMAPDDESFFQFLARQLGSEEAAGELMKKFTSASWGSDYTIWEHRPDLSMSGNDK